MSGVTNGVVQAVDSKAVSTKFGSKPTFSFQVDGQWFKTGFSRHGLNPGDVVSFAYSEGSYGKEVDAKAITKGASGVASGSGMGSGATGTGGTTSTPPRQAYSGGGKGVFPIPALDGQRSIIRQNALTNAREMVVEFAKAQGLLRKDVAFVDNPEREADRIIAIARIFESYSAGDIDAAEVAEEMAAESAAKKAA